MSIASMALKNLSRQKRRTILLASAVAFGILVITVVNGLTGSLVTSLSANVSNMVPGHITVRGVEKSEKGRVSYLTKDAAVLEKVVENLGIPGQVVKSTVSQATLVSDSATQYQNLTGQDLGPHSVLASRMALVAGSFDPFPGSNKILLSETMAKKLGVKLKDRITVQSETKTGQQNVLDFQVGAIYKDPGMAAVLAGAYADIGIVNRLRDMTPGEYTDLGIFLNDVATADDWGAKITKALEAAQVPLWPRGTPEDLRKLYREGSWTGTKYALFTLNDQLSMLKGVFTAVNTVAFGILMVLFLVIMVGIANTYRMVIFERTREIGTLRALGMQRPQIRNLFLLEAVFLALGGILAGFVLGVGVLWGLSWPDLSSWKDLNVLLKDNRLQLFVDLGSLLFNLVVVAGMTVLAAFLPARKAGRLTPAEALRATH